VDLRDGPDPPVRPGSAVPVIEKPIDKRSAMVDRNVAPKQVLCYVCCAEFGTNSLPIHQKTCIKKHEWGLNGILNDESVSKKVAAQNRKRCTEPGTGPLAPLPSLRSTNQQFEEYNLEAQQIFFNHAEKCLWCRTQNKEAMLAAQRRQEELDEQNRLKALAEEAERKRLEDLEEARRRNAELEAQKLKQEAEDAKKKLQAQEDERRRLENLRMKALKDAANQLATKEVGRWMGDQQSAIKKAAEDEAAARKLAEEVAEAEERRRRLLAQGKHKYLKKGEGVQAAAESAKVQHDKEIEEKAKHDIAYYSLNHAKKEGLLAEQKEAPKKSSVLFKEVELDAKPWDSQWTPDDESKFSKIVGGDTAV
jgi:hypothetical protein